MGTAQVQGELWGSRARDWAELQEPAWLSVFQQALVQAGIRPGAKLLDVGCGAGGALVAARELGAEVAGLDGSENLVAIARERLPGARIEIGDMEDLPFEDESFDIVTGINSFQFASDMIHALSEARRVCRRGGTVFMLAWGRREECEFMTVTMSAVLALLPPPAPGAPPPPPNQPDELMREAGLKLVENGTFSAELAFPDTTTAVRAILSAGATVKASRLVGEERVSEAVRGTLPAVTRQDGSVAWNNRFRWVKACRE